MICSPHRPIGECSSESHTELNSILNINRGELLDRLQKEGHSSLFKVPAAAVAPCPHSLLHPVSYCTPLHLTIAPRIIQLHPTSRHLAALRLNNPSIFTVPPSLPPYPLPPPSPLPICTPAVARHHWLCTHAPRATAVSTHCIGSLQ